jgi:hypothetical protein
MITRPNFLVLISTVLFFAIISSAQNSNVVVKNPRSYANANIGIDVRKTPGATVRGRLVYDDTGRPIRHALFSLAEVSEINTRSYYNTANVKTDEDGEFVIRDVGAGSYFPVIQMNGILNPNNVPNSPRLDEKPSELDTLFEKIEISGLGEFNLFIRAKRGGSITGKVTFHDGEVAVGMRVEALRKEGDSFVDAGDTRSNSSIGTTQTDDRGFYRFTGLPEGKYIVRVIEPVSNRESDSQNNTLYEGGLNHLRTYFPEGEDAVKAKEIDILFGQEQNEINIPLTKRKLFQISGKILAKSNKQPLSGFNIGFYRQDRSDSLDSYTAVRDYGNSKSDSLGNWTIRSLQKGKYRIDISQGYVYLNPKPAEKGISYSNLSKEIEITDADISGEVFEMPLESSISGTYTTTDGKSIPQNLRFMVVSKDGKTSELGDYGDETPTVASKTYVFFVGKLKSGPYKIFALNEEYFIKSIKIEGQNNLDSFFDLKEEQELKNVQIILSNKTGTLKGKVDGFPKSQNDSAVSFNTVVLLKSGYSLEEINLNTLVRIIDSDGSFEINAPPGEYSVIIVDSLTNQKSEDEQKEWFRKALRDSPKVEIKVGEVTNLSPRMPTN